jgi:hypothetical protein
MTSYIPMIRSLGFGALFGAGLAGVAYTMFPQIFSGATRLQDMMVVGGFIGAGIHEILDRYVVGGLFGPLVRATRFYASLAEIVALRRAGLVGPELANDLLESAMKARFGANHLPIR